MGPAQHPPHVHACARAGRTRSLARWSFSGAFCAAATPAYCMPGVGMVTSVRCSVPHAGGALLAAGAVPAACCAVDSCTISMYCSCRTQVVLNHNSPGWSEVYGIALPTKV